MHFEARSPSPSSNFDYQTLPYIEHPDHAYPAAAAIGGMGHAPGNYQPIGASELRLGRLPSSSEYRDEALSFSTLPTSQFALKPSSLAMDLSDQQHSLLMHNRSCVDVTLEPYSWSWVRNAHLNPLHLRRTTTDHGSSSGGAGGSSSSYGSSSSVHVGGNYHPHPSSAPTNYHHQIGGPVGSSGNVLSNSHYHHYHQQHTQSGLPMANEPRDISRSSLSVTSSKTIILSNAPVSHAPPTATPTPSTASGGSTTSATASAASLSKTFPVVVPSKVATAGNQSQLQAQQLATARRAALSSKSSSNNASSAQQWQDGASQQPQGQSPTTKAASTKKEESKKAKQQDGGSNKAGEKKSPTQKSVATAQQKSRSPSSSSGGQSSTESAISSSPRTTNSSGVGDAASMKTGELESATDGAAEPMDTLPPSLSGIPRKKSEMAATNSQLNAEKSKSSEPRNSVKKVVEDGEPSKGLSAWMVGKPAASILQLSRPRQKRELEERNDNNDDDDSSSPPKAKVRRTLVASAEAALLISSQFAQQIVKKEETAGTAQPLTVTHALNSAVMGIAAAAAGARNAAASTALSTAGLPLSTADAISHNITKIPLSLAATASNLPSAAKQLLALDAIQPLQQRPQQLIQQNPQQQEVAIVPAAVTVPVAPIMNSVPDGIGGHLAGVLVGQDGKKATAATTVVNAVSASGQAQALPPAPVTNLAVRRSSTGTNGTNSYQEIFHTERVKQALAG